MKRTRILGTGSYLPKKILTNSDLEKMVNTTDEWIVTRTGIKERRIASSEEASSDLGLEAAKLALKRAGMEPAELDLIITATITPDMLFPSTSCLIQQRLGAKNACVFDLNAACTGFIYALSCADQYLKAGTYRTALVIATETLSKIADWQDRSTCVLFGDGAGAAVLRYEEGERGIISTYLGADGSYADLLNMPAGGSRIPATLESVNQRLHFLKMKGNEVFKVAVQSMILAAEKALDQCGIQSQDLKVLIPHQANTRIIQAVAKRLDLPQERVFINVHKYGNMSAATIPVALDEVIRNKMVHSGELIELVAFGAGFTWGACLIRW